MKEIKKYYLRNLIYNFFKKKQKSALYNALILLHLYKTNKQNLKIYNNKHLQIYFIAIDIWIVFADVQIPTI